MATKIQRAFAFRAAFIAKIVDATHDWCPRCTASEAFHPEICPITPEEWRQDASAAVLEALALPIAMDATRSQLVSSHGLPGAYAALVVRNTVGHSHYVGSPARLPADVRRKIAAYWYRWQVAS